VHCQLERSSARLATTDSNASHKVSTCAALVAGETSIMLWNGAIRQPRFSSARWIACSSAGACAASASVPFLSGPGAQMNSTRAPTRTTCHGRP